MSPKKEPLRDGVPPGAKRIKRGIIMRRIFVFTAMVILVMATAAFAGPIKVKTVEEAKASDVGTIVELQGKLVKKINDRKFVFSDGTGELLVNVKGDDLKTKNLSNAKIEVDGVISQILMYTEVDVDSLKVEN